MNYIERPFEYLRRKSNGELFEANVVRNWYKARAYVRDRLKDVFLAADSDEHLHAVVMGDSGLMLAVVRQLLLSCHYLNYNEYASAPKDQHRTLITIVSGRDKAMLRMELEQEEYLCNLPKYGKGFYRGMDPLVTADGADETYVEPVEVDVELQVLTPTEWAARRREEMEQLIEIGEEAVEAYCMSHREEVVFAIDTRKAQLTNRMYRVGASIDNLPYENIHNVRRYMTALDVFQCEKLKRPYNEMVEGAKCRHKDNQVEVLDIISNIACSDCFRSRYLTISAWAKNNNKGERESLEHHHNALCMSEHTRWVVEKLVLGYRPMSNRQRLERASLLVKAERKEYDNLLKRKWRAIDESDNKDFPSHIDLCSNAELRRIDPDNMKYDSFLTLCIPEVLRHVGEI